MGAGAKALLVSAVVTAIASAIISPQALSTLVGLLSGSEEVGPPDGEGSAEVGTPDPEGSASPTPALEFKSVVDPRTTAVRVDIPHDWQASYAPVLDRRDRPIGPGITASPNIAGSVADWTNPRVFVGASRFRARELRIARSMSSNAVIRALRQHLGSADWTREGCEFEAESQFRRRPYFGLYRRWRNCGQVGSAFWELAATTRSRDIVIELQLTFAPTATGIEVAEHALESFEVSSERVPSEGHPDFDIPAASNP